MLLGLDLGTTNIKALVVAADGAIAGEGSSPVSLKHVADGGVEQDIEEIWQGTLAAIRQAGQATDLLKVRAVGISAQGGALQLRDTQGRPVGPVASWLDARGARYDRELTERMGEEWFAAHTGHGESSWPVGTMFRVRESSPQAMAWPNRVGWVGDFIVARLCGRAAHYASSAVICSLYNPRTQAYDIESLKVLGLRPEQLPDLLPQRVPAGPLNEVVARETGLAAGIPVSAAAHDQYAAALGCGAIEPGDVMFGAGTAWVLLAVADRLLPPVIPTAWVCDHIAAGRWGQMLSLIVGGSVFKWAQEVTGLAGTPAGGLDELIESVPPGSDGLLVLPFHDGMGGRRRLTSGRIHGLRLAHGQAHLLRASLEGLCLELARQLGWLGQAGCPARRLILCGGAGRSRCTPQIVADVTGCRVTCPEHSEISAFGAAILARAMIERDRPIAELFAAMARRTREIQPGPAASAYAEVLQRYIKELS